MRYKEEWDKSRERFRAFWNREIVDRCLVSVSTWKDGAKIPEYHETEDEGRTLLRRVSEWTHD